MGLKNEVKITYFEKPRNSALAADVVMIVMMMSRHRSYYVVDRILMSRH